MEVNVEEGSSDTKQRKLKTITWKLDGLNKNKQAEGRG